ncbi:MAG: helix-turn-helix transcriptional regulator [Oscillospiraceae bacterium]|nr:helix-turn-helix transcriptional regulator [Oscillospiraceae bacterium]
MKSNISENIKYYRRQKNFTQEQLAEAMGVSVGAVSKWESASSVPELSLIMELADFFEISVDALLGYKVRDNSAAETAERIRIMRLQKNYENAFSEVEKAVQKFPNNFDVVYQSGGLLYFLGLEKDDKKAVLKSKELLEHALALVDQPHDRSVGKSDIYDDLSGICFILGDDEKGMEMLKEHNDGGIFDAEIGYNLSAKQKKYEEALPFLSDSLVRNLTDLFKCVIGFANIYANRGKFDTALDALETCFKINEMFRIPKTVSYLDKGSVILLTACAQMCESMNDEAGVRRYLTKAKNTAETFDSAPDDSAKNVKFYEKDLPASAADDFGDTAINGIENIVNFGKEECPLVYKIWQEVKKNGS